MLGTGCVVRHNVRVAGQVSHDRTVAVRSLLPAGFEAEVGSRAITGDGAFSESRDGGGVVGEGFDGRAAGV